MSTVSMFLLAGIGGAAVLAAFWCAVLALCAWVGGWRKLAARYAGPAVAGDGVVCGLSARLGLIDYSGVLLGRADDVGLSLAPIALFRPFHPPLCIPWSEMDVERVSGWWRSGLRITPRGARGASLRVTGRSCELLNRHVDRMRAIERNLT